MEDLEKQCYKFKKMDYVDFNIENFYSHANKKRYNDFLINYVLKYYNDIKSINDYYLEKNLNGRNYQSGIFRNNNELSCTIPKRQTLFDEMVCINELTHLVCELKGNINNESNYNNVIPFFNEYEYLKSINEFYAKQYEIFRLDTAIKFAKKANKNNMHEAYSYINAYLTLLKRKDNYNINKLNKINATSKDIEKKLIIKGYTS